MTHYAALRLQFEEHYLTNREEYLKLLNGGLDNNNGLYMTMTYAKFIFCHLNCSSLTRMCCIVCGNTVLKMKGGEHCMSSF